jgi:DNA replication licensing factor MCM3
MLSSKNFFLNNRLIKRPREYIVALREAASESAQAADPSTMKVLKHRQLQVGFEGNFGANLVSPRGLLSTFLNSLVEVEGIVTKGSSVQPKLVTSVQFCAATSEYRVLEHRDDTSADLGIEDNGKARLPTNGMLAKEDSEGNPLELEQGLSTYKDYQTIVLQEMPERAKVGQLPRSIELMLEYDLVDKVKPGDRVKCVGVYQPLAPPVVKGACNGVFKPVLICNNISVIGKEVGAVKLTAPDIRNIKYVVMCVNSAVSCQYQPFESTSIRGMLILLTGCKLIDFKRKSLPMI